MTRETKLGLILGTSFVSLVAVVLFNTWTRTEDPQTAPEPEKPTIVATVNGGPEQGTAQPPGSLIPVGNKVAAPQGPANAQQPSPLALNPGDTIPPLPPGPTKPSPGAGALPPGPVLGSGPTPGMPPGFGQTTLPPAPPSGPGLAGEPERLTIMPEVEYPAIAYNPMPPGPTDPFNNMAPTKPVPVTDNNMPPAGPPGLNPKLLAPPTPIGLSGQPGDMNAIKLPTPPSPPGGGGGDPLPAAPNRSMDPMPRIGADNSPSVGVIPVPSRPNGASPPAHVESHLETLLVAGQDEDFVAMSNKAFGSPAYAQALNAFNRDHPADPLAGLPPGTLKSGVLVYVPPADVLKQKYGSLITASPSPSPSAVPPPQYVSVTPLKPVPPPDQSAPPPPPAQQGGWTNADPPQPSLNKDAPATAGQGAVGNTKPYWVPAGGKYYFEIARETLGDGQRWGDIWRLNSNYPPENQIPAGTQLRLPSDARVQ
jgi:hypothetical protein